MKPNHVSLHLLAAMLLGASPWVAAQDGPTGPLEPAHESALIGEGASVLNRQQDNRNSESIDVLLQPCGTTSAGSTFDAHRLPALIPVHQRRGRDAMREDR